MTGESIHQIRNAVTGTRTHVNGNNSIMKQVSMNWPDFSLSSRFFCAARDRSSFFEHILIVHECDRMPTAVEKVLPCIL